MSWATAHPAGGAQFADGLGPFAGAVGDQSDGLPDDTDPATSGPGCAGVAPRGLGLVVGQRTGRDQVCGNPVGAFLAQAAKVAADLEIECVGGRPFGQLRPGLADVLLAPTRAAFRLPPNRPVVADRRGDRSRRSSPPCRAGGPDRRSRSRRRSLGSDRRRGAAIAADPAGARRDGAPVSSPGRRQRGALVRKPSLRSPPKAEGRGRSAVVPGPRADRSSRRGRSGRRKSRPWPVAVDGRQAGRGRSRGRPIIVTARPITVAWAGRRRDVDGRR